jgi:hypothetical protein
MLIHKVILINLFHQSAPAHYPCGPAKADQTMAIMPHVGWANAIPDAVAQVELDVNGTNVKFSGRGYHDSKV